MADYAITGKKGSGKSLFAVGVIRDALRAGKRVATNLDVHLDHLFSATNKLTYIRLPDRVQVCDFEALGRGQDGVIEDDNGILVLDETSTFFNARSYADKSRQPLLDWLVHSRKLGWDVYYICQGLSQIDKQLRETMIEYHIPVKRTDKWPIPVITPLTSALGVPIRFPRMHVGIVKHGTDSHAMTIERRWYRGRDLYSCYDTQQIFLDRDHPLSVGLHTKLSAYHIKGRYSGRWEIMKPVLYAGLAMGAVVGLIAGGFIADRWHSRKPEVSAAFSLDTSEKAVGLFGDQTDLRVVLSSGAVGFVRDKRPGPRGYQYLVDEKWVELQQ